MPGMAKASRPNVPREGTHMNQFNIPLIALALIAFSTGAMAQSAIPAVGARSVEPIEPIESIESVKSVALAATARKAATARLDVMYEVAKEQCNIYPVGSRAYCLDQMKVGFGK